MHPVKQLVQHASALNDNEDDNAGPRAAMARCRVQIIGPQVDIEAAAARPNPVHLLQTRVAREFGIKGTPEAARLAEQRANYQPPKIELAYNDEGNMVHPRCDWFVLPRGAREAIEEAVAKGRVHDAKMVLNYHTPHHLKYRR